MTLARLQLETEYRSAQSDLATTFYRWCLEESHHYDRAAGYFSSTVFLVVGSKMIDFARRGGKIRLICSPQLTEADVEALSKGHAALSDIAERRLMDELDALLTAAPADFPVRALATFVAVGAMEIRVAVRTSGYGIFHEKLGVFEDKDGNAVSFIGSANETWNGWHQQGNYEAIEVFSSWSSDALRVAKHRAHFTRIWERRDPSLIVLDYPDAVRQKLCTAAVPTLEQLEPPGQPARHDRPAPRQHQAAALEAWALNGFRGIFKHATGSGKTLTAIFAIEPHVVDGGVALIFVPSTILLDQWHRELTQHFRQVDILMVGAGNQEWRSPGMLRSFTSSDRLLGGRIVLATIQTARSDAFLNRLRQGEHLLVVADEVHQLGSRENSRVLKIEAAKRLGLSATPERYNDSQGTARIFDYFGGIVPPEYALTDAIADGHLVPYEYHPHVVSLEEGEVQEWRTLSHQISVAVSRQQSDRGHDQAGFVERLLIRRARIAKKAVNKLSVCQEILKRNYKPGQRWLVYCEDSDQLNSVVQQTRVWSRDVMEYHTAMEGDARATLQWFQEHAGILVAIACLDEGVNIPSVSHALVLASSQNPRQFIQRRGRILRPFTGKRHATIHDVLVSPENVDEEPTQKSLLKSELRRAQAFSSSSMNPSASAALRLIAVRSGIDPDSIDDSGSEESEQLTRGSSDDGR